MFTNQHNYEKHKERRKATAFGEFVLSMMDGREKKRHYQEDYDSEKLSEITQILNDAVQLVSSRNFTDEDLIEICDDKLAGFY